MGRATRRTRIVRLLSVFALMGGIHPGWGSPGDVLETAVPVLGGDVPKSRDLAVGDATVATQTGALTYGFPIDVPPGRLVEPSLALTYSSAAPIHGSAAGAGWSISIPEIRDDPTQGWLASQSAGFTMRYVSSLAGGNRLVEVDEPAPADAIGTYRAQFDGTYARYERLGLGHWRVRTTDGLTHHFGEADHMPDAATGVNDASWAPLTRTVDPFGNTVHYYYFQVRNFGGNGDLVEHVLDRIEYTANPAAGIDPHAVVDFTYSPPQACGNGTYGELPVGARFEPRRGQVRWVGARRLDTIVTRVRSGSGWREVRTVALGFDEDADGCSLMHGPLRLLTSIQESALAPDGLLVTTKPAVTFGYGPLVPNRSVSQPFERGSAVYAASPTFIDSLSGGYRPGAAGLWPQLEDMLLDLDGDGRADRLFAANMPDDETHDEECALTWQRNNGDGFASASTRIELPTFYWGVGQQFDEKIDCSLAGQRSHFENKNNCVDASHYLSYRFVDVNGDRLPELVAGLQYEIYCLEPSPPLGDSPIPSEWGWDPDRECPSLGLVSEGSGWCPELAPDALKAAEVCEPYAGCKLDQVKVDEIMRAAPRVPCGELIADRDPAQLIPPPPGTEGLPRKHLDQCGEYLWLIYWNRGGGAIDQTPTPTWSPIPLESNGADTSLGNRNSSLTSNVHAIMDIDGDGLVDVLQRVSASGNTAFYVFRGDGTGSFHPRSDGTPYLFGAPSGATTGDSDWDWEFTDQEINRGYGVVFSNAGVMDLSGDGLPDLLLRVPLTDEAVYSYLNVGDRFQYSLTAFQNPAWLDLVTSSVTQYAFSHDDGISISSGYRAGWMLPLDWDEDGRVDFYRRTDTVAPMFNDCNQPSDDGCNDDQGWIWSGDGGGSIPLSSLMSPADRDGVQQQLEAGNGEFRVLRDFVDLNGDGASDYIEFDSANNEFVYKTDAELLAGKPLRLLNRIDSGAGGVTDIRYRASTDTAIDIDIPATDDTQGMPTHTWLVDTITRTDTADALNTTGTETGTTTYRYGRPIFNQARFPWSRGQYGFRGFERVQATSPLGAVTESVYDYSLDWSGRLVETNVYASATALAAGTPDSIEQTTWDDFSLFCPGNAQAQLYEDWYYSCVALLPGPVPWPSPLPAISFQPVERKSWTCSNGQTREDCLSTGALRVESTVYQAKATEDSTDGLVLLFHPFELWRKRADTIQPDDRLLRTRMYLYGGADHYRLRPFTETTWARTPAGNELRGQRDHTWTADPAGRPGAFEERVGDLIETGASSTELRYNELNLGLTTGRKKPHQFHTNGPRNTIAYGDTYKVFSTATTNERGHVGETDHDLGTGALLSERGPNSVPDGSGGTESEGTETVVDGFGRPLEVFAWTEDPADGTYRKVLVQRFVYQDNQVPQKLIEERRLDWDSSTFTRTETEFDGFGRVQVRIERRFEAGTIDPIERFRYDAQGNIARVQVRDPSLDTGANVVYLYEFDALDRPTEVERPDGSSITWTYDGLATTRREVAATGPEAETTTTKDIFGRLVQVDERIDALNVATTLYHWDANDNLDRVENPDGIVTVLHHDWMSRRDSITRGERTWVYTYDRNGNMVAERSPVPQDDPALYVDYTTTVAYDALDRPTSRTLGARQINPSVLEDLGATTISFVYDQGTNALGRLTSVSNPIWTRTYQHDARGNVVEDSLHFDLEPALGGAIEDTRTRTRTFNPLGGAVDEWHGDGTTLSGSTHTTTTYSRRGQPDTLTWQQMTPVLLATATRNGAGLMKSLGTAPVIQTWTHDSLGRVTSTGVTSTATGQPAISETWTYYGADDPATLVTTRTGLPNHSFTFSFDDRHQLWSAENNQQYAADFSYSTGGRLLTADVASVGAPLAPPRNVTYDYPDPQDPADAALDPEAVKALVPASGGFSMQYGFDLAGNVTSRAEGGGQPDLTFLYDGEDQQRIATTQNGDHELYYYDHTGQRILSVARQAGGTISKVHLWLGSLEVEYDGSNNVTQTLAHLALEQPVARIENRDTAKRVAHGQLGHFLGAFTPNAQALDVAFIYGPFGEILAQSGADPADYTQRFNGKEQDALTDLSYYGARYFDPLSLTWTQADPLYRFAPDAAWDEPRRANLYTFTLNNPLAMVDPDGQSPAEMWRDLNIPSGRDVAGIRNTIGQINAASSSSNVRASQSLAFLTTSLGLRADKLAQGIKIVPGLANRPRNAAYAQVLSKDGRPIVMNFDRRTAAAGANVEEIALAMTTLVHEFVHVEGGDEAEAYRYEQKFLEQLYQRGFINKDQYDELRSDKDTSVSAHLEGKGGGKERATCEECLKYGLNPNGSWGLRRQLNDLDRFRGAVP